MRVNNKNVVHCLSHFAKQVDWQSWLATIERQFACVVRRRLSLISISWRRSHVKTELGCLQTPFWPLLSRKNFVMNS